jgi:hypothetical protein
MVAWYLIFGVARSSGLIHAWLIRSIWGSKVINAKRGFLKKPGFILEAYKQIAHGTGGEPNNDPTR